jgi:GT2 family glycosyltransferase
MQFSLDRPTDLSVIIVNWKSVALLRKCLESIVAGAGDLDLEVLVIDNASYDGSAGLVSECFPSVLFIQSEENLGFASANNRAFQHSRGRNILFLNPDTEIVGGALNEMVKVLQTREDAGMVGPKLLNPDLSVQTESMRVFPTIVNELFGSAITRRIFAKSNFWGDKPIAENVTGPTSVYMLPGSCLLVRREVFEAAGRFNENYFMYAEDVELSYKIKSAGWKIYYCGNAEVIHHAGSSSTQKAESHFSTVMMKESVWKFLVVNRGAVYAWTYRVTTAVAATGRLLVLSMVCLLPVGSKNRFQAWRGIRKWVKVWRWCVGLEGWARAYRPTVAAETNSLATARVL